MSKKFYTDQDVRKELARQLTAFTQAELAQFTGIPRQNVSAMALGAPIRGKLLAWLGFKQVQGLYERGIHEKV